MAAHPTPHSREAGPVSIVEPSEADPEVASRPVEPVTPAEAGRRQLLELTPPRQRALLIGGGVAAALAGGAVGYWLGSWRTRRAAERARRFAAVVGAAAELAPVASRLLANPALRALAIRLVVRQLRRQLAA